MLQAVVPYPHLVPFQSVLSGIEIHKPVIELENRPSFQSVLSGIEIRQELRHQHHPLPFQSVLSGIEIFTTQHRWRVRGAFNRSFLKLKSTQYHLARYACLPFNRSFLELKCADGATGPQGPQAFNRSFLELKLNRGFTGGVDDDLSIGPFWN